MGRIIAIDYGIKRTGIAVTDELQLIATPLTTVETNKLPAFLKDYFQQEKVDTLVVGLPRDMKFHYSESMKYIERFAQSFKKKHPAIPLVFHDERFTSKMAKDSILAAGKKKKDRQDKALVDKLSACIILQSYMQKIN